MRAKRLPRSVMNDSCDNPLSPFLTLLAEHLNTKTWVKLLLSKYRGNEKELQRLNIRIVSLRNALVFSFVYSYKTCDITKNHTPTEGLQIIADILGNDFKGAHFLTSDEEIQLDITKKGKVSLHSHPLKKPQQGELSAAHNREKKRYVDINRPFLTVLGVTDQQQQLIPSMSRKWKQINKFIEIFSLALSESSLAADKPIQVVDFGSGKGYLTFAIHDYLTNNLNSPAKVSGVELRQKLVNLCTTAAQKLQHRGLAFVCGDVKTHAPTHTDVMIALHACDVATDYAIHYGIRANANIIMCSPCCHKQIRPQMQSPALLKPMLQYGVHLGQEAEMVTDSLRALLLEANGYATKVFEFISLEHTNKNKMILAVKRTQPFDNTHVLAQIAAIMSFYGIKEHCLQSLLAA